MPGLMRQTEVIGCYESPEGNQVHVWPPMDKLQEDVLSAPLKSFAVTHISYMTGQNFGCLKFTAKNTRESAKFGDGFAVQKVYQVREA